MAVFWISECLPLAITSLLPLVLLPLAGVLGTKEVKSLMKRMLYSVFLYVLYFVFVKVSIHYLGATNMMFVAGLMMAVAVEHCGLHHRFAIIIIIIAMIDICDGHHHH